MKTLSGLVIVIGLCLTIMIGDVSARGFGGFRGGYGGYRGDFGGFDGGARGRLFRAGEDVGARRAIYEAAAAGFYAGGLGVDESDSPSNDDFDDNGD